MSAKTNAGGVQNPPPGTTNSPAAAAANPGSPWFTYIGLAGARAVLTTPFVYTANVLLTDTATGVLDLDYGPQILQWLKQK